MGYQRGRILHAQTVGSLLGDSFGPDEPEAEFAIVQHICKPASGLPCLLFLELPSAVLASGTF